MKTVTCLNCGWVSIGVSKEYAEAEVLRFNTWYLSQPPEVQAHYNRGEYFPHGPSTMNQYRCLLCGKNGPYRAFKEGDCPDGCTLNSVVV